MDRYLVAGAVCLLLLEIFILAADFGDVALDSSRAPWATGQRIGDLKRAENEVRRRGRSSLVWDESQTQDALFAYDSVLTLKDSTAQIRLRAPSDPHASGQTNAQITPQETQDTILNLDENTLVVLEPTEESQSGSLRLRFSRGAFRARNPSQAMNIETRSFSLDAKPGTELSLVGLENGNFEVELSRGEATLTTPNGVERVTSGERVRLSQEEIVERAQVSEGLQWGRDIPDRIYARQFPVPVPLSWNGLATDAEIIAPDKSIRLIHLQDPSTLTVEFPHGTSLVRLRNGDQSSSTATIQVRHAPSFQYFTPLPRDRARTGTDLLFSWQRLPEAHSYRLELSADATFDSLVTSVPTKDTRVTTPLRKSGTYFWRIVGLDADGYAIPAPRAYPLYITPQPLQAPELQTPELREPADAGEESDGSASLWNWILPLARAQTASSLSATFTWGAVSGADHYVIEISRTPGFEDPLVLQKVTETKFTWVGFAIGNYFWRVAAGSGSGPTEQLGLFSAPALARLDPRHANAGKGVTLAASEPPQVSPPVRQPLPEPSTARAARHQPAPSPPTPPVQLTQIAADTKPESREPKPEPPSLVSSVDAPTDPAPSSSTDTSETVDELRPGERKIRPRILASPRYGKKVSRHDANIEGRFEGAQAYAGEAQEDVHASRSRRVRLRASYLRNEWKPKAGPNPLQQTVIEQVYSFDVSYRPRARLWSLGLGGESFAIFQRRGPAQGAFTTLSTFGPSLLLERLRTNQELSLRLDSRFGDGWSGGRATADWLYSGFQNDHLKTWVGPYLTYAILDGSGSRAWTESAIGLRFGVGW